MRKKTFEPKEWKEEKGEKVDDEELFAFVVKEHECDLAAHENQSNILSERLYSATGEQLDVRMSSRKMKNANISCRFQVGDIVDIIGRNSSDGCLSTGIITSIPANLAEPFECIVYSEDDDDEPFFEDEAFSTDMLKPSEPVDEELRDALTESMKKFDFKEHKKLELMTECDDFEADHNHWEEKLFESNSILELNDETTELIKNEDVVLYMPWYDLLMDVENWNDVIDSINEKKIYEGKIVKIWINQDSTSLIGSINEFTTDLKQSFVDVAVGIDNDLKFGSVKILCVKCDKEYIG